MLKNVGMKICAFSLMIILVLFGLYELSEDRFLSLVQEIVSGKSSQVVQKISGYLEPAPVMIKNASKLIETGTSSLSNLETLEAYFLKIISPYPQFSSFFVGDENGNFLMIRRDKAGFQTKIIKKSMYVPTVFYTDRDNDFKLINSSSSLVVDYDPRTRPWYKGAYLSGKEFWTDVYIFFTTQKPGITVSYPIYDNAKSFKGVFGIDVELLSISSFLTEQKINDKCKIYLLNDKNKVVAYSDMNESDLKKFPLHISEVSNKVLEDLISKNENVYEKNLIFKSEGKKYIACISSFPDSVGIYWKLIYIMPESHFTNRLKLFFIGACFILIILLLSFFGFSSKKDDRFSFIK